MSGVAIADIAVISGADVIAAYGRELATAGGCGGRPATLATLRVYASIVRALARDLGRDAQVDGVWITRHELEPPATLIDTDYANLLRVPDRRMLAAGKRMLAGKRDYARDGPGHRLRDRSGAGGSVRTWPADCPPRDAGWRCPHGIYLTGLPTCYAIATVGLTNKSAAHARHIGVILFAVWVAIAVHAGYLALSSDLEILGLLRRRRDLLVDETPPLVQLPRGRSMRR